MTGASKGPMEELGRQVERLAGASVAAAVMIGSESVDEKECGAAVARWTKGAMERLDAAVPAATVVQIMAECGKTCTRMNPGPVDEARARRLRYATEEEFLEAEVQPQHAGMRLEREGNVLHLFYFPRSYTPPLRCYCSLGRGLPEGETMSASYCQCSRAFVQTVWENALGRPLTVELVKSAISGADECEFRITI